MPPIGTRVVASSEPKAILQPFGGPIFSSAPPQTGSTLQSLLPTQDMPDAYAQPAVPKSPVFVPNFVNSNPQTLVTSKATNSQSLGTGGAIIITGKGTVTTTGVPVMGNLTVFSSPTSITNGNLIGDAITTGSTSVRVLQVNGVAYPNNPAVHQVPVVTAANTITYKTIPNCTDVSGGHLNYTQSTDSFSCGASSSGVTSIATTSPITGGTITTTGTIACATCVTSAASLTNNQLVFGAGGQGVAVGDLTGDVTTSGSKTTTIAAGAVTSTKVDGSVANSTTGAFTSLTDAATVTWAINNTYSANASLLFTVHGGSRTLNITNPVNGGSYVLWMQQDATGGEGLVLGSGCTWKVSGGGAGAITPSTGPNAIDVLYFTYDGTNCYANFIKNYT